MPDVQRTENRRRQFSLIRLTLLTGPWMLIAGAADAQQVSQPLVHAPVTPLSSEPLTTKSLAPIETREPGGPVRQRGDLELTGPLAPVTGPVGLDPLVQRQLAPAPRAATAPTIVRRIDGIPQQATGL